MKEIIYLIFCIGVVWSVKSDISDSEMVRQLSTGSQLMGNKILTSKGINVHAYLGIPYAEPPTGSNRYKSPIKKGKWDGILDAREYKVSCLYNSSLVEEGKSNKFMSEDCLHLNVFTSEDCLENGDCPVLVYLQDGEFNYGSPLEFSVDDIADNWASDNIIVVTLNYRLGSFGFLNTGEKTSAVKNAGLLDQIEALNWIQREINNFGGDESRVTLFGKGTGAINVEQLAISPATDNLFSQIILIGGAAGMMPYIANDTNVRATQRLATLALCTAKDTWGSGNMENVVGCLRDKDAAKLLAIQRSFEGFNPLDSFKSPVLDAGEDPEVLPKPISELMKERRGYKMLIGNSMKETNGDIPKRSGAIAIPLCIIAAKYRHLNSSKELIEACREQYKGASTKIIQDISIYLPIFESAYTNTDKGGTTFLFEAVSSKTERAMSLIAANETKPGEPSEIFAREALSQFIKNGDPSNEKVKWEAFTKERANYLLIKHYRTFKTSSPPVNIDGYHRDSVIFWDQKAINISATAHEELFPKKDESEEEEEEREEKEEEEEQREEEAKEEGKKGGKKEDKKKGKHGKEEEARTTGKPSEVSKSNATWSTDELKNVIRGLINGAIEETQKYRNISLDLRRQWEKDMQIISDKLTKAVDDYKQVVVNEIEEYVKEWAWKHRCGGQDCAKTTTRAPRRHRRTTRKPSHPAGQTRRPTHGYKPPKPVYPVQNKSEIVIDAKSDGEKSHFEIIIPQSAYKYLEEIIKLIDQIFEKLKQISNESSEFGNIINKANKTGIISPVESTIRRSILRSMYPVIIPSGNGSLPTVPTVERPPPPPPEQGISESAVNETATVVAERSHWYNSIWFWVIHVIAVVLIIALIIVSCAYYNQVQKRRQYETIS